MDQPHPLGQAGAGIDTKSPCPVKRTEPSPGGQEELLHHQVAWTMT